MLLMGPAKGGKAQPIDEPVLTPKGWRKIGHLRVGDEVIGSSGKPCRVTHIFPQGKLPIVRVTADDGAWTRCSEDHLWLTTTRRELFKGRYYRLRLTADRNKYRLRIPTGRVGKGSVKTAAVIAETIDAIHYIPALTGAVQLENQAELVLQPYYLGLLIGDGSFRNTTIAVTNADDFIISEVVRHANSIGDKTTVTDRDGCAAIYIAKSQAGAGPSNTRQALIQLGLDGLRSEEKFLPVHYLYAHPEMRLELLRGLCDTDGHASLHENGSGSSQCEFSTSSPQLCEDVVELVRSLGGRALIRTKETPCLPAWSVMISFTDDTCPFATPTKTERWIKSKDRERYWRKRIETVEDVGEAECVCIRVDAEDALYVTRGHLLTHNSSSVVMTAPRPIFVINGDGPDGLSYASHQGARFESADPKSLRELGQLTGYLLKRVEAGEIKTVIFDTITLLQRRLVEKMRQDNNDMMDQQAWGRMLAGFMQVFQAFIDAPCHLIVIGHSVNVEDDTGGEGTMPAIQGQLGKLLPTMLHEWVWLNVDTKKGAVERQFLIGPQGKWMHGCRHAKGAPTAIEADIKVLLETLEIAP